VDAVALLDERALREPPLFAAFLLGERRVAVDGAHLRRDVGQHEELRVLGADLLAALVGERHFARTLVDCEVQLLLQLPRVFLEHLREHLQLAVLVDLADVRVFQQVHQLLVLRHRVVDLVELVAHLVLVVRLPRLLRLLDEVVALGGLHAHDRVHERLELDVDVARRHRCRTRDDERRARLVDQDRVHFVHDGEVVAVLHDLLGLLRHAVVAQVVEAELAVRAVGDIARVLRAALGGIHRVLDAADGEAEELVEVAHPARVAPRQVVVDGDELHVLPRQRVQVQGQRRDERLAFARLHFRDLALVQDDAAQELHVERHHVPFERVAAHLLGRADQVAAGVLDERVRFRQDRVETFALRDARLELGGLAREILGGKVLRLVFGLNAVDFADDRPQPLQFAVVLRPEEKLQQVHRIHAHIVTHIIS